MEAKMWLEGCHHSQDSHVMRAELNSHKIVIVCVVLAVSVRVKLMTDWFGWKVVREMEISNMFGIGVAGPILVLGCMIHPRERRV